MSTREELQFDQLKPSLRNAAVELLRKAEGGPVQLVGIGGVIAAQALIEFGLIQALGGLIYITGAGRAKLATLDAEVGR